MPGVVSLAQSFGSLAHWHPHLHLVVTDGAFRLDGGCVTQTAHDAAVLVEVWRRSVLVLFVREGQFEQDAAALMLAWRPGGAYASGGRERKFLSFAPVHEAAEDGDGWEVAGSMAP